MKVLLTGAGGFVGSALWRRLATDDAHRVVAVMRSDRPNLPAAARRVHISSLDSATDWRESLNGVDAVVHLAARTHVIRETECDPLKAFRRLNVEATMNLARQAAKAGVRRFVFISSIKVNGECSPPGSPFTADMRPNPEDGYGISKREAEDGLRRLSREAGIEVVIIRPALVYGEGVKANFRSMMMWLQRGLPLPLGAVNNRRSLVALDNLVDLVITGLQHPGAANQTFLASDGEDLSTTELLRRTAAALGKESRLVPVPVPILRAAATIFGRRDIARRLLGTLQVDITKTKAMLEWNPPVTVDEALDRTARHFIQSLHD